jgi:Cu/Ag efflux pump CusA
MSPALISAPRTRTVLRIHPRRLPLVVAQGAAEISRHDVGTPVFAGMIAASAVGLFVIPMLYVTFQTIRERSSARFRRLRPRPGETD